MTTAYGINLISFNGVKGDGSNQTIAIVDAYDAPNISSDLAKFDSTYGVAAPPSFQKAYPTGVKPAGNRSWAEEESLDVEWAHAVAPKANIILVEAASSSLSDLYNAVTFAKKLSGVSVVSMSWGGGESSSETGSDSIFTSPSSGHGVTFVASSGDSGNQSYPALSPNVVGVGGTTLHVDSAGNWQSETGWSGSGGGVSSVEGKPTWQSSLSYSKRAGPDVALDADPNTGASVYFSYGFTAGFYQIGGTSLSSPMFAGLIAIANQGRALSGKTPLDGPSQTLPALYSLSSGDFHDITSGSNKVGTAGTGFDLVTGRGSAIANKLVTDLAAYGGSFAPAAVVGHGPSLGGGFFNHTFVDGSTPSVDTTNPVVFASLSAPALATSAPVPFVAPAPVSGPVIAPVVTGPVSAAAKFNPPSMAVGVSANSDAVLPFAGLQWRYDAKPTGDLQPDLPDAPAVVPTSGDDDNAWPGEPWAVTRATVTDSPAVEPTAVKLATGLAPVAESETSSGATVELAAGAVGFLVLLGTRVESPEAREERRNVRI
jgi:hypothetical protein